MQNPKGLKISLLINQTKKDFIVRMHDRSTEGDEANTATGVRNNEAGRMTQGKKHSQRRAKQRWKHRLTNFN